jgi:hypothetical protein
MPRPVIFFVFLFLWTTKSVAQRFVRGQQSTIQASQILIDNYTTISLLSKKDETSTLNIFDNSNPYTFIQNLTDSDEKIYQILFQTDFLGKLHLLAISNNLNEIFNCADKPRLRFLSCIKDVHASDFPTENIEKALHCLIERLNYCGE